MRIAAPLLTVACFAIGAGLMLSSDYRRPSFTDLVAFSDDQPGAVVVDAVWLSPGPLTNLDVEGRLPRPGVPPGGPRAEGDALRLP
ncbi:MAG: hypothetical protein R2695_13765 [Acidimicrobiales bacterium]